MRERSLISPRSVPYLPRGVRLRRDPVRARMVLLAPERVLMPDAISVAILERCDGRAAVDAISRELAEQFDAAADEIQRDVIVLLQDLSDRGYVRT